MKRDADAALAALARTAARPSARRARWPRATLSVGLVIVATAALFASSDLHSLPAPFSLVPPVRTPVPAGMPFELADDPSFLLAKSPPGAARHALPLAGATRASPEGRLIAVYRAIGEGRMDAALQAASALAHDMPGFRLAQAVYADLLAARIGYAPGLATGSVPTLGTGTAGAAPELAASAATEMAQLQDEAVQRLRALQERPPADAVPDELVMLPKSLHHLIAVDASRSRLYLFENGPAGIRLVDDHYVSIGRQGVEKSVEGDQRTPLGVYFVADRMGGGALDPQFGAGALQLNYPNAFDRLHGRTGGGIYLHGVPLDTYSRPPHDSDGCVALANDELLALMNIIPVHDTPVVITRQLHWVDDAAFRAHRAEILDAVGHWQAARIAGDATRLAAFYTPGAQPPAPFSPPEPPAPPATILVRGKRVPNPAAAHLPVHGPLAFDEMSVLDWTDEGETFVVTFRERMARVRGEAVVRQYWTRDKQRWRIVAEGAVR